VFVRQCGHKQQKHGVDDANQAANHHPWGEIHERLPVDPN
jgi:hypothetical protein